MEAAQGQICAGKDEDKRQKWRFWSCSYFMLAIVSSHGFPERNSQTQNVCALFQMHNSTIDIYL